MEKSIQSDQTGESMRSSLVEESKKNNFLVVLLSVLLFISIVIAGFFAYQTQQLVKELAIIKSEPILTSESFTVESKGVINSIVDTTNWKVYPPSTIIGLPYSFKYPKTIEMVETQDLVYFMTGNATIYHGFLGKQTDILSAMNNFKPWGTNEQVSFSSKKEQVETGLLKGYKVTSLDGYNTFLFLGSNELNGILVFHYPTVELKSGELLDQILSTFKFTN